MLLLLLANLSLAATAFTEASEAALWSEVTAGTVTWSEAAAATTSWSEVRIPGQVA